MEPGSTTTFGALLDKLEDPRDRTEDDLKSDLYTLRVSGIVHFDGPLRHDTPIECPASWTPDWSPTTVWRPRRG